MAWISESMGDIGDDGGIGIVYLCTICKSIVYKNAARITVLKEEVYGTVVGNLPGDDGGVSCILRRTIFC